MAENKGPTGPRAATIKRLFAVSGNQCAFSGCTQPLYEQGVFVAEICHIKGEKPKAKRYDPQQSNEDRHGFENLILLCPTHHTVIDQDARTYTVDRLQDMKRLHEANKQTKFEISDDEAARLAHFAGGITIGTAIGALAAGLAELIKAVGPVEPAPPPPADVVRFPTAKEWEPFRQILERIGPGKFAIATRQPLLRNIGYMFGQMLSVSGHWRQADPGYYLQGRLYPENIIVLLLEHHNPDALKELLPVIERLLSISGFQRIDDPERARWNSTHYPPRTIEFWLIQLRPEERGRL